ncbi:MAG: histidine kinase [Pyrinomonadaceae bacterium]
MKRPKNLRTALTLFLIWTVVGLAFTGIFYLISRGASGERSESFLSILRSSLLMAYLWGSLSPLLYLFARKFTIDPRRLNCLHIAANLGFGILITVIHSSIYAAVNRWLEPRFYASIPSFWMFVRRGLVLQSVYSLLSFYFPTFFSIQALLFFRNYQAEEAKNAELQAQLSRAQLSALKMQLHPHFLFNSLHSISSLILLDPKRANTMVSLLGDFLRQTLEHSDDQMVTLAAELEFLRCYLEIEQTRFEDRLSVDFDIDPHALDAEVPHLIAQPIVENAIKHGISPYSGPGYIEIAARRNGPTLVLRIKNSGPERDPSDRLAEKKGPSFGLANVAARLESIYGPAANLKVAELSGGGFQVELTMPIWVEFSHL